MILVSENSGKHYNRSSIQNLKSKIPLIRLRKSCNRAAANPARPGTEQR